MHPFREPQTLKEEGPASAEVALVHEAHSQALEGGELLEEIEHPELTEGLSQYLLLVAVAKHDSTKELLSRRRIEASYDVDEVMRMAGLEGREEPFGLIR